jgi:hypothetical protein
VAIAAREPTGRAGDEVAISEGAERVSEGAERISERAERT